LGSERGRQHQQREEGELAHWQNVMIVADFELGVTLRDD
jgi:hypothetical protein